MTGPLRHIWNLNLAYAQRLVADMPDDRASPFDWNSSPYCEQYISVENHTSPTKPLWMIATALVCLVVAAWWVFRK